jgi:4-methyl-5(b-hydroxyethyl)-thiazole monophosphate biosynthesis
VRRIDEAMAAVMIVNKIPAFLSSARPLRPLRFTNRQRIKLLQQRYTSTSAGLSKYPPVRIPVYEGSSPAGNRGLRRIQSTTVAAEMAATAPKQRKQVLLPIANGSEEMEVVIVADILRRAGAEVTLASVEDELEIVATRNVKLVADTLISSCEGRRYDLIVLPGGMPGAEHLRDSQVLQKLTQTQAQEKRMYAAICAAPAVAFESWGVLNELKATCHPCFTQKLGNPAADLRVVNDGLVTTSQGPGTAIEFALSLVEQLYGKEKRKEVAAPLVLQTDGAQKRSVQEYNLQEWKFKAAGKCFQVLVPIANGSEEMEIVIIVDVLRRAGFRVIMASVEKELQVLASRNVKIMADQFLHTVPAGEFDMIVLPGGMPGAERLRDCESLTNLLSKQLESKKPVGAICAAPAVVCEPKGLLKGKKATSHPAFSAKLSDQSAVDGRVVIDGVTVTSRGPGTAMEFALSIVEKVYGNARALRMAESLIFPYA